MTVVTVVIVVTVVMVSVQWAIHQCLDMGRVLWPHPLPHLQPHPLPRLPPFLVGYAMPSWTVLVTVRGLKFICGWSLGVVKDFTKNKIFDEVTMVTPHSLGN